MSKMKYINRTCAIFPGFYESDLYNSDTLYNINYSQDEGEPELDFCEGGFEKYCESVAKQAAELLAGDLDQDQDLWREHLWEIASNTIYEYLEPVATDEQQNNQ